MKKFFIYFLFYIVINFDANAEIINDVKIENNNRISKETIITYGNINLGSNYLEDDLNEILKNLYKTNFFKNIIFEIDNNVLKISVEENKIIQSISIEGVKSKTIRNSILENLFSKDKAPFLIEKVKTDLSLIKSALSNQGFYLSNVESEIIENNNNTVDLIFKIDLGDKSRISKIEFIGDKKIKDRTLRNIIVSEEHKFWKFISKNKYINTSLIERDKRLLKNYYLNQGYYNVLIESATVKFNDNKSFKLTYKINAGDKFYINSVNLNLPINYDEQYFLDVKEEMNKLVDREYSLRDITKVVDEVDKISLSRQYDFINASLNEEIIDNNKINLTVNIEESEQFFVERINIFGNNVTHESVIRNKLEIDEGDPFNELLNSKSINNLRGSGLFKTVDSTLKKGKSEKTKIIDITVEEKPTGEISVGAGAGSDGGTIGFSVSENNFLGKGVKLSTSLRLTEDSATGEFTINNPNYNYTGKSLFTSVESTIIDKLTENGYETHKTGFSFGTGFEQFENFYISPKISTYYEDLTTSSKASDSLKKQSGTYLETKFSYGLNYDMRNQVFQTSEGFRSQFNQNVPIYSDEYPLSTTYDFKQWFKLSDKIITSLNFYAKQVNSLTGDDVRITNRFYLPRNKLKGFKTRQVGPKDGKDYIGGNYAAALNFDTTIPGLLDNFESIDVKYFIDAANIWGVDYSSSVDDSNKIRSSTGFVFDWFTPIGPLNFSLSQDINKVDSDKTESFQFNLGTTF